MSINYININNKIVLYKFILRDKDNIYHELILLNKKR